MAAEKSEREIAADKRRQAEVGYTTAERKAEILAALQAERRGYVQRELDDRVAAVDAEIKRVQAEKA